MKANVKNLKVNHPNLVTLLSLTMMLIFIVPEIADAQTGKANFSGKWALNEEKSTLGQGRQMFGGGDMIVKQEANLLTVERTFSGRDGQSRTMASKYSLDGKETVNTMGNFDSKTTANWSDDGKSLTIVTKFSFNGNERSSTEVWNLSDAKTLSITSTRQGRDGEEVKTTSIYDKE